MRESLEGLIALVTGASSGIGQATAYALAREGADVVIAARREQRLNEIADDIREQSGADVGVAVTDITEEHQVKAMVQKCVDWGGTLDIVVNNAGILHTADVEDTSTAEFDTLIGVNVRGMFLTARESLPHLREVNGNLTFVGSVAGRYPRPYSPLYAATKWWTRGFALSLAGAVGEEGVAISVVGPDAVRTEIGQQEGESFRERFDESEALEPEDVAEAIVFSTRQEAPVSIPELDLYLRNKFSHF